MIAVGCLLGSISGETAVGAIAFGTWLKCVSLGSALYVRGRHRVGGFFDWGCIATRKMVAIIRIRPIQSAHANGVFNYRAEQAVALTGSIAPSMLPRAPPTMETPFR